MNELTKLIDFCKEKNYMIAIKTAPDNSITFAFTAEDNLFAIPVAVNISRDLYDNLVKNKILVDYISVALDDKLSRRKNK